MTLQTTNVKGRWRAGRTPSTQG